MAVQISLDAQCGVTTASPQHEAALKYASQGFSVFPLIPDSKRPLTPSGFKDASTTNDQINEWWTDYSHANIGIPTAGLLVLDVDCKNDKDGYAAVKELEAQHGPLPVTLTQTTPSGGKHYIYNAAGKKISSRVNCPAEGLDIRGEGGYIVAAPSAINGVSYEMDNATIVDAPEWLVELVHNYKKPELKIVQGGRVGKGSRNETIFAMAIDCNRSGLTQEAALEKILQFNAQSFDPALDEPEVTRTVASAYRYDVSVPAEIAELNEKHSVINIGGKIRIMNHVTDPDTDQPDVEFSSPADFKVRYCNRFVDVKNKYGEVVTTPLAVYWLTNLQRSEYAGITFNPVTTPPGFFNLWTGHPVEAKEGDCSKLLAHIKDNIASGNKVVYDYIISWMAHIVQNPSDRIGIALVMRGSMGTGKGVFANAFGSLFGRHYLPLAQGSQLTGKFNAHMKDKVLLFADESFWAGDKSAEGVLKALITEPFLVIEGKGENAYKIKNHLHFIFATNNEWCVPAGPQERRFFVMDIGEQRMQDHAYFEAIQHELDNGGREALLYYLKHHDVSNVNLRKFPQTAALMEQKIYSMTPIQKFWFGKLESGNSSFKQGWDEEIATKELYGDFIKFCNDMGIRHRPSDAEFGSQIKKLVPGIAVAKGSKATYGKSRPNVYRLPSLQECRAVFEKFINYQVKWPVYEDQQQEAA